MFDSLMLLKLLHSSSYGRLLIWKKNIFKKYTFKVLYNIKSLNKLNFGKYYKVL